MKNKKQKIENQCLINYCKMQIAKNKFDFIDNNIDKIKNVNDEIFFICLNVKNTKIIYEFDKTIERQQNIDDALSNLYDYIEMNNIRKICN